MKTRVVIFDLDGVLFDSDRATLAFYHHIFQRLGKAAPPVEEMRFAFYTSVEQSLARLFPDHPNLGQILNYVHTMDIEPFLDMVRLEDQALEVLESLRGLHKAVCTNRSLSVARSLEKAGIAPYFDLVVTARDVERPKPHPDPLQAVLQHFALEPDQALYVGDSEVDLLCARAASVPFLAYRNPGLDSCQHIQKLSQILDYLGNKR